jgi:Uma2 family endonuclease
MTPLTGLSLTSTEPRVNSQQKLPTMYDLPSEFPEEPGLPDEFHDIQPQLLSRTLSLRGYSSKNRFTGSDINIYYDPEHPLWHKRPDWFLAVNVPRVYQGIKGEETRLSYVVWEERQPPTVIVEFLSARTEKEDLGRFYGDADYVPDLSQSFEQESFELERAAMDRTTPPGKVNVYESCLRVPHYIVYSRYTQRLRYFKHNGIYYDEQPVQAQAPQIWLSDLEIGLGIWEGYFEALPGPWLRWCDAEGNWLLTDTEKAEAEAERAQAEAERAQAEAERAQAEAEQAQAEAEQAQAEARRLAEKLRELGIDPHQL